MEVSCASTKSNGMVWEDFWLQWCQERFPSQIYALSWNLKKIFSNHILKDTNALDEWANIDIDDFFNQTGGPFNLASWQARPGWAVQV